MLLLTIPGFYGQENPILISGTIIVAQTEKPAPSVNNIEKRMDNFNPSILRSAKENIAPPPMDVYYAAAWSALTPLSGLSIEK